MSEFFSSDIVRETMHSLADMQDKLITQIIYLPYFTDVQKKEHLQLMKSFLEKQKILYFRMSLSNDPEAIATRNAVIESAKLFGLLENQGMVEFFDLLTASIDKLEKSLDL